MLNRLILENIRNIGSAKLASLAPCNIFYGMNGSGKTSVLEAINIISVGRSFRSQRIQPVIRHGADSCTVFAEWQTSENRFAIGVRRDSKAQYEVKINGDSLRSVAALADYVPIQLVYSDSFLLLTGGPKLRRQFLDWGVFHVEPRFHQNWQMAQKAIKQRNSLLRRGKITPALIEPWNQELINYSNIIDPWRRQVFSALSEEFSRVLNELAPSIIGIRMLYFPGWDESLGINSSLDAARDKDLRNGYTSVGPHRAAFSLVLNGLDIQQTLSRGQLKIVLFALKIAQGRVISSLKKKSCVYLLDDLPAELDENHRSAVCGLLEAMGSQVFITCIDKNSVAPLWRGQQQLFHVEHGSISAI